MQLVHVSICYLLCGDFFYDMQFCNFTISEDEVTKEIDAQKSFIFIFCLHNFGWANICVVFDFGFPPQCVWTLLDCLCLFLVLLGLEGIQLSCFLFSKTLTKLKFQRTNFSARLHLDMLQRKKGLTKWNIFLHLKFTPT